MIKKDNYDKRVIIATIISTILIVVWARYRGMNTFTKSNVNNEQTQIIQTEQKNVEGKIETLVVEKELNSNEINEAKPEINNAKIEDKRISIDNEEITGTINLKGLTIDDITLNKYNILDSQEKFHLLNSKENKDAYFITFGWKSDDKSVNLPNQNTVWNSNSTKLSPNNPITLTYENDQNITFELTISIDNDYMLSFNQAVINNSDKEISISTNNKIFRKSIPTASNTTVHEGFVGSFNSTLEEIKYKKLLKKDITFNDNFNWAGFTDKYWLVSFAQKSDKHSLSSVETKFDSEYYVANFSSNNTTLEQNQKTEIEGLLFIGAKELPLLDQYVNQYNLALFDRSVDFGWFYFLTKPIYIILKTFYSWVGNFGVAILILTFVVKFVMYPFTKKSFVSMARLKKIQPKIDAIKSRYSNDKMRVNKEVVELYKKEEISPLSGCLPLLVQIPVFFSLYKVLSISIDMRQAAFFGYIKNLSEKDPTTIWNLFGLLPYNVGFLPIGLLPCLMCLTMWIQQKMTAQGNTNPESQAVTKYMPLIFLFLFAGMPSGLLIYWTFSNIITIGQQYYIEKRVAK